jgi:dTDP-4-dehydrorhamnose 3,5-epimerase
MKFTSAPLADAWLIELEPSEDARGFFTRAYCEQEFSRHGLNTCWRQINHSYSAVIGTLRGMHYQRGSNAEIKLLRCLRGEVYDVIVDLRPSSPTQHKWFGIVLTAENQQWLYVPKGFAHGLLTLTSDVEMEYMASAPYIREAEGGFRYDDPHFNISWPRQASIISLKDESWPNYKDDLCTEERA